VTRYSCCDPRRRTAVSEHGTLLGIDFLEVTPEQQRLEIHFVLPSESRMGTKPMRPPDLTPENVRISGGERISAIRVLSVDYPEAPDNVVVVTVADDENPLNGVGDFSPYTLHLVSGPDGDDPPANMDPRLSAVEFSFKVGCPSDFNCREDVSCPPSPRAEPEIDYLAKDYASFRRLLLDRMSVLLPDRKERIPADMGVALVELLAYVGDQLSYRQDVVSTEAYLGTARLRTSVRRHARLVDYSMHDGCNARVWVQVNVSANLTLPKATRLLTRVPGLEQRIALGSHEEAAALAARPEVFETMHEARLDPAHNELHFYTWGDRKCCLPAGATHATLIGRYENLRPNDVLIFEERIGPKTGSDADADPSHRHAVCLIGVNLSTDPLGGRFQESPDDKPIDVTEIEWHAGDALRFPLCLSADTDSGFRENISVALGNIVLADHGRTITESLPEVPSSLHVYAPTPRKGPCDEPEPKPISARYRPRLANASLTQAVIENRLIIEVALDPASVAMLDRAELPVNLRAAFFQSLRRFSETAVTVLQAGQAWTVRIENQLYFISIKDDKITVAALVSAVSSIKQSAADAKPQVELVEDQPGRFRWNPQPDLLSSDQSDRYFVAEIENDGRARLRFGDGQHGERPGAGSQFTATYRVGNGIQGNVGADSLVHVVTNESAIVMVRNPLPASGGTDPELIETVRQAAPFAFRIQERAVTPEDYAEVAQRHPEVQRAAATFRWTGSWRTVFVTIDRVGGVKVDPEFKAEIRRHMERYRMAGYDLEIDKPRFVSLEIDMRVCVKAGYFRSEVKRALLDIFSRWPLADGRRGIFHPDNFTFGQPVYLSPLYAAAQTVAGVLEVTITTFQRQGQPATSALDRGLLPVGRLEIARLDNDRNYPEHGVFRLKLAGGL